MAVVPPPGAKYDKTHKKVIIDENLIHVEESDDERTARVLVSIPNSVIPGIEMEYDVPREVQSRHSQQGS